VTYVAPAFECKICGGAVAMGTVGYVGEPTRFRWFHDGPADHDGVPDMPDLADPGDVERWLETPEQSIIPF
jgi:hypothetical protein